MIRRPLVRAASTLCALLTLSACNGSPEAGTVTPAPTTATATPTASPTPAATTPAWTEAELQAIKAAKARYTTARAAIDKAMSQPQRSSREPLERAGLGGNWLITAIGDVRTYRDSGWYQSGATTVASLVPESVTLTGEQPQVKFISCLDTSKTKIHFQSNGKLVPIGPGNGSRHRFRSQLAFAPPVGKTSKSWFLLDEKSIGPC